MSSPPPSSVSCRLVERPSISHEIEARRRRRARELGRDSRDRRGNARVRLHGQGALERLPQDRLHDLAAAAAAAARRDRRPERGRRERGRDALRLRALDDVVAGRRRRSAIGLFDNLGPNSLHAEPTILAAEAGKHVVCEKPLGRDADESYDIWQRVAATGVKHMCAFNYRFVPAVRLARELIDAGELGEIRHFRGRYLQDWGDTDAEVWRFDRSEAGLRRARRPRRARRRPRALPRRRDRRGRRLPQHLRPEPRGRRCGRGHRRFANGAVGTLEATRLALGRRNAFQWEINGTKGSLAFDMERLNELQVFKTGDRPHTRLHERARLGGDPSVLGALVAARPHHRLGRHVRPRAPPLPGRDRRRHRRRAARRDVRGRLPGGRGVRRDRPLRRIR